MTFKKLLLFSAFEVVTINASALACILRASPGSSMSQVFGVTLSRIKPNSSQQAHKISAPVVITISAIVDLLKHKLPFSKIVHEPRRIESLSDFLSILMKEASSRIMSPTSFGRTSALIEGRDLHRRDERGA